MKRLKLSLFIVVIFSFITATPALAADNDEIHIQLAEATFLGGTGINILVEVENYSNKKLEVFTVYSNSEIPVRDPGISVNQTYPFVGSLDPYYGNTFKYQALVRGYLFTEFTYAQGVVKFKEYEFRKTGYVIYEYRYSNVINMKLAQPNI